MEKEYVKVYDKNMSLTGVRKFTGGVAGGVATLDSSGRVPAAQLPSYVDDVIDVLGAYIDTDNYLHRPLFEGKLQLEEGPDTYDSNNIENSSTYIDWLFVNLTTFTLYKYTATSAGKATEVEGEEGKIYLCIDNNKQYRWSGSRLAEINPSPGSTDAIPEGSCNKYFTEQRAKDAVISGTPTTGNVLKFNSDGKIVDSGYSLNKSVPDNAQFTDTTYDPATPANSTESGATGGKNGLMSAVDKARLNRFWDFAGSIELNSIAAMYPKDAATKKIFWEVSGIIDSDSFVSPISKEVYESDGYLLNTTMSGTWQIVRSNGNLYLCETDGGGNKKITSFYNNEDSSITYNPYVVYQHNFYTIDNTGKLTPYGDKKLQVVAHAICQLYGEIRDLKAALNEYQVSIKAHSIDAEKYNQIGVPMVLKSSTAGAPSASVIPNNWDTEKMGTWTGCPRFVGQQYIDTANKKVYTAAKITNSTGDWVALN